MASEIRLTVYRRERAVRSVTLRGPVAKLGGDPKGALVLEDQGIGLMHAVIELDDDGATLIDLGTEGGTHVNGVRINRVRLRAGDDVQMGASTRLRIDAVL